VVAVPLRAGLRESAENSGPEYLIGAAATPDDGAADPVIIDPFVTDIAENVFKL
jgi:hypothetical protein